jgi:hypothetical protein
MKNIKPNSVNNDATTYLHTSYPFQPDEFSMNRIIPQAIRVNDPNSNDIIAVALGIHCAIISQISPIPNAIAIDNRIIS